MVSGLGGGEGGVDSWVVKCVVDGFAGELVEGSSIVKIDKEGTHPLLILCRW